MLLSSVDRALDEFIQSDEPRVFALTGDWGRGKTFYWRHFLATRSPDAHRIHSYAYVSLFGLKNLSDVQDALVAGAVPIDTVSAPRQLPATARSLLNKGIQRVRRVASLAGRKARTYSDLVDKIPKLGELGPFARAVGFRLVDNYLVCIDDVERRSTSLPLKDVLGMASLLREQRGCRVLIILNSDALSPEDRDLFHTLREKVFDAEIAFEPSAAECAEIAFPNESRLYNRAAQQAIKLEITNIRVLYRIRRLLDAVAAQAMAEDDDIQTQVIHSSVLLGWCFNSRDGRAPPFAYVKGLNFSSFIDLDKTKERSPSEAKWNELLSDYGYTNTDELDAAICEVLERGYVDTAQLAAVLSNRAAAVRRARLEQAFEQAWGLYHGSFDPSPEGLAAAFEAAVTSGAEVISSVNMSATSMLLRSLGYDALADRLTAHWISVQAAARPAVLNIAASDWREEIRDEKFRAETQAAFDRLPPMGRSFRETAIALSKQNGWNDDDIAVLSRAGTDEYYELFKSLEYPQTGYVVRTLIRFGQFAESQLEYRRVADSARAALVRIGRESDLNRGRVKSYGVDLDAIDKAERVGGETHPERDNKQNDTAG